MNRRHFLTAAILAPFGSAFKRIAAAASRMRPPILWIKVRFADGWKTYQVVHDVSPSGRPWTLEDLHMAEARMTTSREDRT